MVEEGCFGCKSLFVKQQEQQIGNCAPEACIVALGVEDVETFLKNVGVLFVEEEESGELVRAEIIRCMRTWIFMDAVQFWEPLSC